MILGLTDWYWIANWGALHSSRGKTISLSIPQHIYDWDHELSPVTDSFHLLVSLLFRSYWQQCWLDFIGTASHSLTANFLSLWLLQSFAFLFHNNWTLSARIVLKIYQLLLGTTWSLFLFFFIVCVFCMMVSICFKEKFSLWGKWTKLICGYRDMYIECSYELCRFNTVVL